jgi:hypothetical protein
MRMMAVPSDNETWIIETGERIIEKMATHGRDALSDWEVLSYCLWVVDYSMRNAGDLATAADIFAGYKRQGLAAARGLGLAQATTLFSASEPELERMYFELFEAVCAELQAAGQESEPEQSG